MSAAIARQKKGSPDRDVLAIAAALTLLERRAKRGLRSVLAATLGAIAWQQANARHAELLLGAAAYAAILRIRTDARDHARTAWGRAAGLATIGAVHVGEDALRSHRSGIALGRAWLGKHDAIERASLDEGRAIGVERSAAGALDAIGGSVDRTATTEVVDAWALETIRQNDAAAARGYVVTETWQAILDGRTCSKCAALDGTVVTRPDRFPSDPPLHCLCRCFLSTEIVWPRAIAS